MAHGGTNFGFASGSDLQGDRSLGAIVTSYDYNAPVMEAGLLGSMFSQLREVYESFGQHPPPAPANASLAAYGIVTMSECVRLWDAISLGTVFAANVSLGSPVSMELLRQPYGWILYNVTVPAWDRTPSASSLCLPQLQDRALVYVDGAWAGLVGWSEEGGGKGPCVALPPAAAGATAANLAILVQVRSIR
jgi:beta-galactosidase